MCATCCTSLPGRHGWESIPNIKPVRNCPFICVPPVRTWSSWAGCAGSGGRGRSRIVTTRRWACLSWDGCVSKPQSKHLNLCRRNLLFQHSAVSCVRRLKQGPAESRKGGFRLLICISTQIVFISSLTV